MRKILRCLPIPGHIFRYFQISYTKIRKNFDTTKILTIFVIQNIILQNRRFTYNLLKIPYKVSEYNLVTKGITMNYRVVATKRESIMKTLTLLVLLLTLPMVLLGQAKEFNRVETTITSIEGEEKGVREISLKVELNDSTITVNNTVYQVKQVFRNVYGDIWVILNNGDIIIDERRMIMRTKYTVEEVEYSQYQLFYSE